MLVFDQAVTDDEAQRVFDAVWGNNFDAEYSGEKG